MAIQLSIITIQVKHNSSGILNAGVSVKKHTVETATHTMKKVTGIHVFTPARRYAALQNQHEKACKGSDNLPCERDIEYGSMLVGKTVFKVQSERPFVYVVGKYQKKQYHGGYI